MLDGDVGGIQFLAEDDVNISDNTGHKRIGAVVRIEVKKKPIAAAGFGEYLGVIRAIFTVVQEGVYRQEVGQGFNILSDKGVPGWNVRAGDCTTVGVVKGLSAQNQVIDLVEEKAGQVRFCLEIEIVGQ